MLSSNNYNYMTQTRFYRSRINPDELSSNYAKEKVMETNNHMNKSYNRNRNIYINQENINYSKDNFNNYKINQSAANLMNLMENRNNYRESNNNELNDELNNEANNEIYLNYSNNIFSKDNKRLSNYKLNSFLENGKTFSKKINNNKYICINCLKNKYN